MFTVPWNVGGFLGIFTKFGSSGFDCNSIKVINIYLAQYRHNS